MTESKENKTPDKKACHRRPGWFRADCFGSFFLAFSTVVIIAMLFSIWQANREFKKAEAVYNTIYAFIATATEEEYDAITAELRHSKGVIWHIHFVNNSDWF